MRKRIAAAMMAVVLAVFPASMLLMAQRSFTLTMARERERALSEEAAIAGPSRWRSAAAATRRCCRRRKTRSSGMAPRR